MNCPKCGGETRVTCLEHHPSGNRVRRFRRCLACNYKFRTTQSKERVDNDGHIWKGPVQAWGEQSPCAVLTEQAVREMREEYKQGQFSQPQLSKRYGISLAQVNRIIRRQRWAHVI